MRTATKQPQLQIHHIGTVRNANHQRIMNKSTKVLCKDCHLKVTNQQIHDIKRIRTIRINS
ncbi:hypothetical protein OC726_02075 [Candidatus Phytoplasma aurantifolia]|nr:hypothetical protein [Candidatus Phytoplasma aurantifolia]